jgi:hypothetical protein
MKQETLEEAAETFWLNDNTMSDYVRQAYVTGFIAGAKWKQEKSYSEENMRTSFGVGMKFMIDNKMNFDKWFEQFKKK